MKKIVGLIAAAIIITLLLSVFKFNDGAKTIEEAIAGPNSKPFNIIHIEEMQKDCIVFYTHSGEDSLSTAVVTKGLGGYKTVYSGVQGDITLSSEISGLTYVYFPAIQRTSLPIYFGVIGNPEISQVRVVEKERDFKGDAKIIEANGKRLWLMHMIHFQGSKFTIIGLSADGKELARIEDDIAPFYAEQKPFKSPYQ